MTTESTPPQDLERFTTLFTSRTFLDTFTQGLVLHDLEGRIIDANVAAATVLGVTRDQLLGRTPFDPRWRAIHEDGSDFPDEERPAMVALRSAKECTGVIMGIDSPTAGRRWLRVSSHPLVVDGDVVGVSSLLGDITEQLDLQHQLQSTSERLRILAHYPADVVVLASQEAVGEWCSDSITDLLGWTPREVVGQRIDSFVHPDDLATIVNFRSSDPDAITANWVVRLRRKDGEYRWISISARRLVDAATHTSRIVSSWRDVQTLVETRHALETSEARYRLLAENGADLIILLGPDGVYRWASPSSKYLFGWTPEEMVGKSAVDFVVAEDFERAVATRDHHAQDVFTIDTVRWRCADGTLRWVSGRGRNVRDADGVVQSSVLSIRDVTTQIVAEQELARSEALFRLVLENQADVTLRLDPDGTIEWTTPSVFDLIGWHPEEVVDRNIADFIAPADIPGLAVVAGTVQAGNPGEFEARLHTIAGDEKWVAARGQPLFEESGRMIGSVVNVRDISAEHAVRTQLARSEEQFRLAMESAPIGMAVVDLDRRFLAVNPALCAMVGRRAQWLLEHGVFDILDPEDNQLDARMNVEALSGAVIRAVREKRLLRPDGTPVWVEHAIGLLRDETGSPLSFVSTFVDVTESRATKEKLRYQATHDTLTHLVNRRDLYKRAESLQRRTMRTGEHVGVLFIDIDGFKSVNDTYGHFVGDMALKVAAERIASVGRNDDVVARVGGDEFVILLHALHTVEDAQLVATKIIARFDEPTSVDTVTFDLGVSIGVAIAQPGEDADDTLRRADSALYEAKLRGRGRSVTWEPSMSAPR